MRCLSCGAEMHLTQTAPHESIPTLEYRTFAWSACNDTERRLMLSREPAARPAEMPVHEAPPTAQAAASGNEAAEADQTLWRNAWAMLKGR